MIFKRAKLRTDSFTSLIAHGVVVRGNILFSDTLKIDGLVIGCVSLDENAETTHTSTVLIGATGRVLDGDVKATNIVIAGGVGCNEDMQKMHKVWAEDTLRIEANAQLENLVLYYRNLEVATGAKITNCQLKHLDLASEGEHV